MAFRLKRTGHHRPIPYSDTIAEVPYSWHRLFHQMGRAEALATIIKKNVRSFVWKNIVCRYGIPRVLVLDNDKQFNNDYFKDFCLQLGIKNNYSSPTHPQDVDRLRSRTNLY